MSAFVLKGDRARRTQERARQGSHERGWQPRRGTDLGTPTSPPFDISFPVLVFRKYLAIVALACPSSSSVEFVDRTPRAPCFLLGARVASVVVPRRVWDSGYCLFLSGVDVPSSAFGGCNSQLFFTGAVVLWYTRGLSVPWLLWAKELAVLVPLSQ